MKHSSINVLFVVVLYNQRLETCNSYSTIPAKFTSNLFVFDNSPKAQHTDTEFENTNIKYISDQSNPGLSYAYNRAAEYANANGIEWMMVLDQDTFVAPYIISQFQEAQKKNAEVKLFVPKVAVGDGIYMSPVKMNGYIAKLSKSIPHGIVSTLEYTPINSGMIINVDALLSVGGYNEKVWLDHSDFQFMKRFRRVYKQMFVLDSECKQEFSNIVQTKEQKLKRFEIFCDCIKNCDKIDFKDRLDYMCLVIRRTLSLILNTRSLKPIIIFIKKYL